jgi:hypothetical protein
MVRLVDAEFFSIIAGSRGDHRPWRVQGRAMLVMYGVLREQMRSICARRTDLCPVGARFGRADARLLTSRAITAFLLSNGSSLLG